jgi:hypothetical protein
MKDAPAPVTSAAWALAAKPIARIVAMARYLMVLDTDELLEWGGTGSSRCDHSIAVP